MSSSKQHLCLSDKVSVCETFLYKYRVTVVCTCDCKLENKTIVSHTNIKIAKTYSIDKSNAKVKLTKPACFSGYWL